MRILVVEDEIDLADAIASGLAGEGFDVEVTHDGADALWRAGERPYDLIVLDVLLPGMNGLAVCEHLRRVGNWTPILVLTVRTSTGDEIDALGRGADDYLSKPFSFDVLLARIHVLLRRRSGDVRPLTVGDIEIDTRKRTVRRAGHVIATTPREFALVDALAAAGGAVVTRQELLDRVWGWDFVGNPGVLDVYIGYLRAKLDRGFDQERLETVRGVGFRLRIDP